MRSLKNKVLSARQRLFIDRFMIHRSGAQAVREAGYKTKTPEEYAKVLLRHDPVREEIARGEAELRAVAKMDAEEVVTLLSIVGRANIKTFLRGDWSLRPLGEIPEEQAYAIESVKDTTRTFTRKDQTETVRTIEFKLKDSLSALDKLCKHLGLFAKDNEQARPQNTLAVIQQTLNLGALSTDELRSLEALMRRVQPVPSEPTDSVQ